MRISYMDGYLLFQRRCGVFQAGFRVTNVLITFILMVAFGCATLAAQTGSIHLEGIVWDPAGNPLPGVNLTAVEENTGQQIETVSDSDGYYRFMALQPGIYTVTAKAESFRNVVHRNIHLYVPGGVTDNISFEVSAIDNEIGPVDLPRLLDSDLADAFSQRDLQEYPLFDRNPLGLVIFQPGVLINGGAESTSSINGMQTNMNALTRDGLTMTDPVSPGIGRSIMPINIDAISGVQIITSNAGAEYGGAAGAQVVMTSRRGATSWNGNVYNYFNIHHFNANEYFNNYNRIDRPEAMRNLFGGVISGQLNPKTAIFGSYEGNRTEQQVYRNRLVLTEEARAGEFRWYSPNDEVRTDSTVNSFKINSSNDPRGIGIDRAVAGAINLTPEKNNNYIGDRLNTAGYEFYNDLHYYQDRIDARVDYNLNPKHQIFFRFNWDRTNATDIQNSADSTYPGLNSGYYKANDFSVAFGSDYTLSPTLINELRVGYSHVSTDNERPDRLNETMFYSTIWNDPQSTAFPVSYRNPSFEISDTFSQSKNVHGFKYGFSVRRHVFGNTDYTGAYPTATFGNSNGNVLKEDFCLPSQAQANKCPSPQWNISYGDYNTFENFYNTLLGRLESVNQTFYSNSSLSGWLSAGAPRERNFATWHFSGFVQDNWKIKPNITLNLGLRYELSTLPKESDGYQIALDRVSEINADDSDAITDFQIQPGEGWASSDKLNFAPRVGVAWDVFQTGSTVVRAAYGVYYDRINSGVTSFIDQYSYGLGQVRTEFPNENGTDIRLSDGFTIEPNPVDLQPATNRLNSIAILDPNLKTPRVQQMHATLERQWAGALWEIGYTRTRGTKLFQYLNLNQTKISDDFRDAFIELRNYLDGDGTPVSADNVMVNVFGTANDALEAMGGHNFRSGQIGAVADNFDREEYHDLITAAGLPLSYIRNFPQFDRFYYGTNTGESWYDALRAGVRKNGANYSFRAFYTWSRSKDTLPSSGSNYAANFDSFDPKSTKGYSDFHRAHVLNLAWRYAFPFGRDIYEETDQPGWVNALLAGWNASALWTYESGARFSVSSGLENQYAGVYSLADYDDSTGAKIGAFYRDSLTRSAYWIDPITAQLFTLPEEVGFPGTSTRNVFTGPKYFNFDMAMYKSFRIREGQAFQIRLEAYNVFNKTNFALPNTVLYSSSGERNSNFGRLTSTVGNPRKMQFALRYQF